MTADIVDTTAIRARYAQCDSREWVASVEEHLALCNALDCARDRNAELMNDRTEALNGEAIQRGRAHAAEARIANTLALPVRNFCARTGDEGSGCEDLSCYVEYYDVADVRGALREPTP